MHDYVCNCFILFIKLLWPGDSQRLHAVLFYCCTSSRKEVNSNFNSFSFDSTGDRTRVHRFGSRRSIHSNTNRKNRQSIFERHFGVKRGIGITTLMRLRYRNFRNLFVFGGRYGALRRKNILKQITEQTLNSVEFKFYLLHV